MQFDVEEPVHQVEEQDVDSNAQEPLHQSEERQAAKDTDIAAKDTDLAAATSVAAKDTDVAAALLFTDLATATSIGTTAATSVGNTELLTAMSVDAKDTDVSATLVPATDMSATTDDRTKGGQNQDTVEENFQKFISEQNGFRYIGTLANANAKFFSDSTQEDFQLEEI
ncbi:hypothetical protein Dimus_003377, partial [Dionaea muscipula]